MSPKLSPHTDYVGDRSPPHISAELSLGDQDTLENTQGDEDLSTDRAITFNFNRSRDILDDTGAGMCPFHFSCKFSKVEISDCYDCLDGNTMFFFNGIHLPSAQKRLSDKAV